MPYLTLISTRLIATPSGRRLPNIEKIPSPPSRCINGACGSGSGLFSLGLSGDPQLIFQGKHIKIVKK
jgi:hypothetical protein